MVYSIVIAFKTPRGRRRPRTGDKATRPGAAAAKTATAGKPWSKRDV